MHLMYLFSQVYTKPTLTKWGAIECRVRVGYTEGGLALASEMSRHQEAFIEIFIHACYAFSSNLPSNFSTSPTIAFPLQLYTDFVFKSTGST